MAFYACVFLWVLAAYSLVWCLILKTATDLNLKRNLKRAAYHEIGHACTIWSFSDMVDIASVSIADNGGGLVKWNHSPSSSTDHLWCRLTIAMAGIVAEQMFMGSVVVAGASSDFQTALECSSELLNQQSTSPPWKVGEPTFLIPLDNRFEAVPPLQIRLIQLAAETARNIIRAYSFHIERFYQLLMKKRLLIMSDLFDLLGGRDSALRFKGLVSTFMVSKRVLDEGHHD